MRKVNQFIIVLFVLMLSNFMPVALADSLESLKQLTWKNRILLIKPKLQCEQEKAILLADRADIDDRDIVWFIFCGEEIETNYGAEISPSFAQETIEELFVRDDVTIILIGKDGGVKRRTDELDLVRLYELIDSMPMRQLEMQK
ncbi:MAG: DUF4174 domain-containing protein [Acidiferrobacterales bacterium]|nr:DUF4174 domain-containing protein [Acidiferrobacterales bacterium]